MIRNFHLSFLSLHIHNDRIPTYIEKILNHIFNEQEEWEMHISETLGSYKKSTRQTKKLILIDETFFRSREILIPKKRGRTTHVHEEQGNTSPVCKGNRRRAKH
jgi:hypothetical protein